MTIGDPGTASIAAAAVLLGVLWVMSAALVIGAVRRERRRRTQADEGRVSRTYERSVR